MNLVELASKIRELKEVQAARKQLEAKEESLKEEMKAEMETRGTRELQVGIFNITWKVISQKRVDATRLKEERPEIYKEFLREFLQERFTVK